MRDSRDRIWITVSTRVNPWDKALRSTLADGYILLLDEHGLRVTAKGELTDREIHWPANLGDGFIDGISFDSYGNLWGTMVIADRLIAITPEGDVLELLDDGNHEANARAEAEYATGNPISFETLNATGGSIATWLACVTFGGADLKTAYLGGLKASTIPYFESPVAGLPLAHW